MSDWIAANGSNMFSTSQRRRRIVCFSGRQPPSGAFRNVEYSPMMKKVREFEGFRNRQRNYVLDGYSDVEDVSFWGDLKKSHRILTVAYAGDGLTWLRISKILRTFWLHLS